MRVVQVPCFHAVPLLSSTLINFIVDKYGHRMFGGAKLTGRLPYIRRLLRVTAFTVVISPPIAVIAKAQVEQGLSTSTPLGAISY